MPCNSCNSSKSCNSCKNQCIDYDCPGNCKPCVGFNPICRKDCGKETAIIPVNYTGIQVETLESVTCGSDEEGLYVLETAGYTPWCVPTCCQLRQCINEVLEWILPEDNPYYFYDTIKGGFWKSENGMCSEIKGSLGDIIVDSLTGDVYKLTKNGWRVIGNVNVNTNL